MGTEMPEVDDRGRITIPKRLREELGLSPGTEVEVHRDEDKLVVEQERTPEDVVGRLRELVEDEPQRESEVDETDPHARRHRENVRDLAERTDE